MDLNTQDINIDITINDSDQEFVIDHVGGPEGKTGSPGTTGEKGDPGVAATLQIGEIETLNPGDEVYVDNIGTIQNAILNMGLPKGDKGDKGVTGNVGQAGAKGEQGIPGVPGINGKDGKDGINGKDGTSVNIHDGEYREPGSSKDLPDLPEFSNTVEGDAFIVDDDAVDGQLDLYIHGIDGDDWMIIQDWGGRPGSDGAQGPPGMDGETTVMSVIKNGAVGDGVADDTAAIQNCLNLVATNGSELKAVYLPAGKYKITTSLIIPSGVQLLGAGKTNNQTGAVILAETGASPAILVQNTTEASFGIVLKDFAIIGTGKTAHGIYLENAAGNLPFASFSIENIYGEELDSVVYAEGLASSNIAGTESWACNTCLSLVGKDWNSANTSVVIQNCYANGCSEYGFRLKYATAVSLEACMTASCAVAAYKIDYANGVAINGSGSEWEETELTGDSISAGVDGLVRGINIVSHYSSNCPGKWLDIGPNVQLLTANSSLEDGNNTASTIGVNIDETAAGVTFAGVKTYRTMSGAQPAINVDDTNILAIRMPKVFAANGIGNTNLIAQDTADGNSLNLPVTDGDTLIGRATTDVITGDKIFIDSLILAQSNNSGKMNIHANPGSYNYSVFISPPTVLGASYIPILSKTDVSPPLVGSLGVFGQFAMDKKNLFLTAPADGSLNRWKKISFDDTVPNYALYGFNKESLLGLIGAQAGNSYFYDMSIGGIVPENEIWVLRADSNWAITQVIDHVVSGAGPTVSVRANCSVTTPSLDVNLYIQKYKKIN